MTWVMKLFYKYFTPIEITATKEIANLFLQNNAQITFEGVRQCVFELIDDADKTLYSIRCEHMKPRHLAILLISNVTGALVQSGRYHTYRGILNIQGKELLEIFNASVNTMREHGYITQNKVDEDMEWIKRQVQSVG